MGIAGSSGDCRDKWGTAGHSGALQGQVKEYRAQWGTAETSGGLQGQVGNYKVKLRASGTGGDVRHNHTSQSILKRHFTRYSGQL